MNHPAQRHNGGTLEIAVEGTSSITLVVSLSAIFILRITTLSCAELINNIKINHEKTYQYISNPLHQRTRN